jgi:BirA family biotin operon repressor/biotin-[acetyl-CoA-carboxylase] ligase
MDADLLEQLRDSSPEWISGEVLRRQSGVSRVTISKRIAKLQNLGYQIESSTRKGYRLLAEASVLNAEDLEHRLQGSSLYQHPFVIKHETGSTNDDLRALALEGAPEGTVVVSERQFQGRGRRGRSWFAEAGDALLFSILLRPPVPPGQGTLIPLLAATAVYRALCRLGVKDVQIKWPNDVLLCGKKVCGILCEMSVSLEGIEYAMLGLGLNVSTTESRFPEEIREIACSLASATGRSWERPVVLTAVLEEMELLIHALWQGDRDEILEGWREGAVTPGQDITVTLADGSSVQGQALGVNDEGALRLWLPDGTEQVFHSGEVTLRTNTGHR